MMFPSRTDDYVRGFAGLDSGRSRRARSEVVPRGRLRMVTLSVMACARRARSSPCRVENVALNARIVNEHCSAWSAGLLRIAGACWSRFRPRLGRLRPESVGVNGERSSDSVFLGQARFEPGLSAAFLRRHVQ